VTNWTVISFQRPFLTEDIHHLAEWLVKLQEQNRRRVEGVERVAQSLIHYFVDCLMY